MGCHSCHRPPPPRGCSCERPTVPPGRHVTVETVDVSAFAAELRQRLAEQIAAAERKHAQRAQLRRQLQAARDAWKRQHHQRKETRCRSAAS